MRARILLADDPSLLSGVRTSLEQAGHDVELVQSGAEAAARAASPPTVHALVLPALAPIDGVAVARQLRSEGRADIAVILVLSPADAPKRDGCFAAGADDVLFGPVAAADVLARLEARAGTMPFRSAPRASTQIAIKLLAPNGSLVQADLQQISREAMLVAFPTGMTSPAPGMVLRAAVPLPVGALAVWSRVCPASDPPRCVLRFIGLTPLEFKLIDGFVATQSTSASAAAPAAVTAVARPMAGAAAAAPAATAGGGESDEFPGTDATLRVVVEADLGVLATLAGKISGAKKDLIVPPGFSLTRLRQAVNRLAPTETSALRGTTMYNEILPDLRESAGAKLMLNELTQQLKTGGASLDKRLADQVVQAAITLADTIHDRIQAKLEEKIKAGDPKAMRDLSPVKAGLLNFCNDLRNALERDVHGKAVPVANTAGFAGPTVARYDKPVTSARMPNPDFKPVPIPQDGAPPSRALPLGIALAVFLALAGWVNRGWFITQPPPEFVAPSVVFTSGPLRVWMTAPGPDGWRFIVDDSWKKLTPDQRSAALEDLSRRAAKENAMTALVLDPQGRVLASTPAIAAAPTPSP